MADQLSQIISQATAPAFLLGAVAGFLAVLVGRANRIADRGVALLSIRDQKSEMQQSNPEITLLMRRAKLTNYAIEFAVLTGICTTLLVIVAFASALMGLNHAYGSISLFIIALAFFAASLICLGLEVRIAIRQLEHAL
jgi:hypothetical protein